MKKNRCYRQLFSSMLGKIVFNERVVMGSTGGNADKGSVFLEEGNEWFDG